MYYIGLKGSHSMRVKPHALDMVAEGVLESDMPMLRSLEYDQTQYLVPHDFQMQCDGPLDNAFYCLKGRALSLELIVRSEFCSSNCYCMFCTVRLHVAQDTDRDDLQRMRSAQPAEYHL